MNPILKAGDIFSRTIGNKTVYWKVLSIRESYFRDKALTYDVIRCNKNGKEFKDRNGFNCHIDQWLDKEGKEYRTVKRATEIGIKANLDKWIEIGKLKRRASFLQGRIQEDQKELDVIFRKLKSVEAVN